jgi:hypothetical protein
MAAPITTLRADIAAVLYNPSVWNTYDFPPSTITANSVIVAPADPYITPGNNTYASIAPMANFKIIMTVPMFDNKGNLNGIETLASAVFIKLSASALVFNVSALTAPSVLSVQSGDLLTADLTIQILTAWS